MTLFRTALAAVLLLAAAPVLAQQPDFVPPNRAVGAVQLYDPSKAYYSPSNPIPTSDANGAAFQGVTSITPGTVTTARRSVGYICTGAGNVTFTFPDASTLTMPVVVAGGAFQTLPFAVTLITQGSGTGCTWWGMK